jgi:hypothetical protein
MSELQVKICPDCGAEHISDMDQCDMCLMAAEMEAFENGSGETITENRIKAFEI